MLVCLGGIATLAGVAAAVALPSASARTQQADPRHRSAEAASVAARVNRVEQQSLQAGLRCAAQRHLTPGTGPAADAGDTANTIGQDCFRDVFGGLELTGHGTHVVVYLTRLSPAAERAIRGGAPAGEFTFRKVSHSAAFLVALQHRITRDWGALRADGIRLVNWGPGFGRENVTVLHLTPAKARLLDQRYGAASLSLHTTSHPSLGIPVNFR
jgi:hypothetical protein